jgi:gluconolactonase
VLYPISGVRNFVTRLDHPEAVAVGRDGALYAGGEAGQVYRISADGADVKKIGGTGGFCLGITLDKEENLYICDCGKRSLLRMTQAGELATIAESVDGRRLVNPNFSLLDSNDNLYFSDSGEWKRANGVVYRLSSGGSLKVFAPGPFHFANGLALDATERHLYIVESNLDRVVRVEIEADGTSGEPEVYAEGLLRVPDGIAFDADGNLYVTTYATNCIYRVATDHSVKLLCQDVENLLLCQPANCAFGGPDFDQLTSPIWAAITFRCST